jgi:hypothetical protein
MTIAGNGGEDITHWENMVMTSPSVKSKCSPPAKMYAESVTKVNQLQRHNRQCSNLPLYSSCQEAPFTPNSSSRSLILLISRTTLHGTSTETLQDSKDNSHTSCRASEPKAKSLYSCLSTLRQDVPHVPEPTTALLSKLSPGGLDQIVCYAGQDLDTASHGRKDCRCSSREHGANPTSGLGGVC